MPDENWVEQISGLVALAGCLYLASPSRAGLSKAPSVRELASDHAEQRPREKRGELSPEVREFMMLPSHIQQQVMDYARGWIKANFEEVD